jgi:type I restriction enzyme S subunit
MREGWDEIELGSVFRVKNLRLGVHSEEPPVFAVSKYDGIVLASEYFDKRIASAKLDQYKVVAPTDWVYSTIHIDEGSITRNASSETGVVSPMYTTMTFDSRIHEPRYFELLLRSPRAISKYSEHAQGTVNRRRSLSFKAFSAISFMVPPLVEQRRIVDLIESVDNYITALETRAETARTARSALLHHLLSDPGPSWSRTPLNDLLERSIGGVWGGEPGTEEIDVTVVRSTEFTASGVLNFDTRVPRSITNNQLHSRELRDGDVLVEKSGGGPLQPVGRVVFVNGMIPKNVVCSNFVQLITPDRKRAIPEFIFLVMWNWHSIGRTLEYQAQTTGIRNLRTQDYLSQIVDVPPLEEQLRIVEIIRSVDRVISSTEITISNSRNLRAALLSDLLSGNHEIPASYDQLLGAA